jgi:hypothetical protein
MHKKDFKSFIKSLVCLSLGCLLHRLIWQTFSLDSYFFLLRCFASCCLIPSIVSFFCQSLFFFFYFFFKFNSFSGLLIFVYHGSCICLIMTGLLLYLIWLLLLWLYLTLLLLIFLLWLLLSTLLCLLLRLCGSCLILDLLLLNFLMLWCCCSSTTHLLLYLYFGTLFPITFYLFIRFSFNILCLSYLQLAAKLLCMCVLCMRGFVYRLIKMRMVIHMLVIFKA